MTINAKTDKGPIKTGEKILVCYMDRADECLVVAPYKEGDRIVV